jgi:hypothetical protein
MRAGIDVHDCNKDDSGPSTAMVRHSDGKFGFDHPLHRRRAMARRAMPLPELIASVALAACTAVAVTMVSMEIAQAESFSFGADAEPGSLALAAFFAVLLTVMGGVTAFVMRRVARPN